jgi:predicted peroxiredoxin
MSKRLKAMALALALAAGPAAAKDAVSLVTVVTDANPQTQLMSMVLTLQAVQRKVPTHILLCGPAADIALKDAPESATAPQPPKAMSPQGALKAAIGQGVKAEVCAIYLPGKGLGPEALIEGVGVAEPPAMAKRLLDRRTRVWSF